MYNNSLWVLNILIIATVLLYSSNTNCCEFIYDDELRFKSQMYNSKLIIKVYENYIHKYTSQFSQNPLIDFNKIINLIEQKKFQIIHKDEDNLSIKIMDLIYINFVSVQQQQKHNIKKRIKQLQVIQQQYQSRMSNDEKQIKRLSHTVNQIKQNIIEISQTFIEVLQTDINKKINQIITQIKLIKQNSINISTLRGEVKHQIDQFKQSIINKINLQQQTINQFNQKLQQQSTRTVSQEVSQSDSKSSSKY